MVAVGFYCIGDLIRQYRTKIEDCLQRINNCALIGMLLPVCVLIMKNGYVNMRIGSYGYKLLFWIDAVAIALLISIFAKRLYRFSIKIDNRILNFITKYVMFVGKESLYFLCMNQLFLWINRNLLPENGVKQLIMFGITMVCISVIIIVRNKMIKMFHKLDSWT